MGKFDEMNRKLADYGVIPVVVIDDAEDAVPLCRALCEGGLGCAEVTFRTEAAEEAIKLISDSFPDMLLGAGTVLNTEQAQRAINAGAKFIVAPNFDPEVVDYCIEKDVPVYPGALTPTEFAYGYKRGLRVMKFFPAKDGGGPAMIKAVSAVFPGLKFMPTGGVNGDNIKDYFATGKVACCGGTWMVKKELIKNKEFDKIKKLTEEAVAAVKAAREAL